MSKEVPANNNNIESRETIIGWTVRLKGVEYTGSSLADAWRAFWAEHPTTRDGDLADAVEGHLTAAGAFVPYRPTEKSERKSDRELAREYAARLQLLDVLCNEFKERFSMERLHGLTTAEQAAEDGERSRAVEFLKQVTPVLNEIADAFGTGHEVYLHYRTKYAELSRAVGIINKGFVDHTR